MVCTGAERRSDRAGAPGDEAADRLLWIHPRLSTRSSNAMVGAICRSELNALTKQGKWGEMSALISDELLEAVAVCAPIGEVAEAVVARTQGRADRVSLVAHWTRDPGDLGRRRPGSLGVAPEGIVCVAYERNFVIELFWNWHPRLYRWSGGRSRREARGPAGAAPRDDRAPLG